MKPWHQRRDESAKAYAAFCHYRDLAPTERSLEKAYAVYRSEQRGRLQTGGRKKAPGQWQTWSTKYEWTNRVQAYDIHNARIAAVRMALKRQAEVQKYVEADFNIAVGAQNITSRVLAMYIKRSPEAIDPGEYRQMLLGYDLSRRWLQELIGFMDAELDRLSDVVLDDDSLAEALSTDPQEV